MEEKFVYRVKTPEQEIEGLAEIKAAVNAWDIYHARSAQYLEGFIDERPEKPQVSIGGLEAKYPRAAAYNYAEGWANDASFAKARFGQKACDRILAGEDHAKVLDDMKAEWAAFKVAQEG